MDYVKKIKEKILSELAFPTLVKVQKAEASSSGYFIDGEAVSPGNFEATGELFKEVSVPPIWADKDGRGIYIPPSIGQIVIVSFIGCNKAFPFVSGVYGEEYKPVGTASAGQIVICDAEGLKIEFDGKCEMKMSFKDKVQITINKDGKCEFKDDANARFLIDKNKLEVGNASGTVKTLLEELIDIVSGLQTKGTGNQGAPVVSDVLPDVVAKCTTLKTTVSKVFGG